ncbi:peptide deformylase [Oceanobacillus luteolus]|uniref:Peptide deformylase n=1 Tax=Oceanobacillus luteolus TaxID=1274358 RepID=A0ABW4HRZ6_9BACI|nr:peptide deformylase [Oceanobacillus luteolus]MCM3739880.1 peptide deformylase [Oceanobacillus luteolus]
MITMKDIVREGHPSLTKVAQQVDIPITEEEKQLLKDMLTFLRNSQDEEIAKKYKLRAGVGLAAPQLGVEKQMFTVYYVDENEKVHEYALVNPKIVSHSVEKTFLPTGEGCLSVDREIEGYVPRYSRITVKAFDMDNNPVKLRLKGYLAIVFQHEIDHLNGIMFYDHINKENPFHIPDNAKPLD